MPADRSLSIEGLQAKLEAGELAASYLGSDRNPQSLRQVVRPTTFSDAEIDYDLDEIVGDGMRLASPEIFDPHDVPLNVQVPDWFAAAFGLASPPSHVPDASRPSTVAEGTFRQSGNYRHVELRGMEFALTPMQARVVARLHRAYLKGDRWVDGQELLKAASSESEKVAQIFRRHREVRLMLIESDGRGMYRLKIDDPA